MLRHERAAWADGFSHVCGIDEAGRGPLAGPVHAAAVLFDREFLEREANASLTRLTDSKQLTAAQRDAFFALLSDCPSVRIGLGVATVEEIDTLNILNANYLAMRRAVAALGDPQPDLALVDGNPVKGLPIPHRAIVKGDASSLSIAAASIVAKVTRDRWMNEQDALYPGYGFVRHKGYGTREHLDALRRLGPCPIHRRTFGPVSQLTLPF